MSTSPSRRKRDERIHVTQVKVTKLNGSLNYTIPCHESGVTLITGPNGYGKTSIIKLLDAIFSLNFQIFNQIAFDVFEVKLSSGVKLQVRQVARPDVDSPSVVLSLVDGRRKEESELIPLRPLIFDEDVLYSSGRNISERERERLLRNFVAHGQIERIGPQRYRTPEGELLTTEGVFRRFPFLKSEALRISVPPWFAEVIDAFNIDFLNAQRLHDTSDKSAVDLVASVIWSDIQSARNIHGDLSQKLDRQFPNELLTATRLKNLKPEELQKMLETLSDRWALLRQLGLLFDDFSLPPVQQTSAVKRQIAGAYLRGLAKKLTAFDDIEPRMSLFRALINEHFELNKTLEYSRERGIEITDARGRVVPLNRLSSGEQHLLVLFGNLLFGPSRPSLVLIDEPELSLHPSWQLSFLSSIERIKQVVKVDFILATHAPAMVVDHKHLMFDMWEAQNGGS